MVGRGPIVGMIDDCFIKNRPWRKQHSVVYLDVTIKAVEWRVDLRTEEVCLVQAGDFPLTVA